MATSQIDGTPTASDESSPVPVKPPRSRLLVIGFFILFASAVLYAFGKVISFFVTPIVLGAIVVILTFPLYVRLRARLHNRENLAAMIMLIGVNLVLVLPVAFLTLLLVQQAIGLARLLQQTDVQGILRNLEISGRINGTLSSFHLPAINVEQQAMNIVRRIPALVAAWGGQVLAGFANAIIGYFFMLFAIFYFYTEGELLVREMRYLSPLPDRYDQELIGKFKQVTEATFRGHMLTALAQGIVTGIGMAIAGIPGALFWGAVAAVFALLPLVGAAAVWVPAAGYLFIQAAARHEGLGWAIFMVLWGVLVVSVIDNVIRPWAMKGGTEMPAVLLLFSVLGGVRAFGFMGIILGPLVFALLVSVIHIYKSVFLATQEA
jgi:predicted PurR-regulated permease PerM